MWHKSRRMSWNSWRFSVTGFFLGFSVINYSLGLLFSFLSDKFLLRVFSGMVLFKFLRYRFLFRVLNDRVHFRIFRNRLFARVPSNNQSSTNALTKAMFIIKFLNEKMLHASDRFYVFSYSAYIWSIIMSTIIIILSYFLFIYIFFTFTTVCWSMNQMFLNTVIPMQMVW